MKEQEVKDKIIEKLYDHEKSGNKGVISVDQLVVSIPQSDKRQVCRVCKDLKEIGWIGFEEMINDMGIVTDISTQVMDYAEKNIIIDKSELETSIAEIKRLEDRYYQLATSEGDTKNTRSVIEAFHTWYDAASLLFSQHYDGSNRAYLAFKNADCSGNGYSLFTVYQSIRANVAVLLSCLERKNNEIVADTPLKNNIFIVFGHDEAMKDAVCSFLRSLQINPVVLNEEPNGGRTLIEKFEENTLHINYAIILMSDNDDIGCEFDKQDYKPRARQNVILELGYFVGKLGRRNHICVLKKDSVEEPSDILGIVYTKYKEGSNEWKLKLADELIAAHFDIDKGLIH